MSRLILLSLGLLFSIGAFAQDISLEGFNQRFNVVRNAEGKVSVIKLKRVVAQFSVKPFMEQIKQDLLNEQRSFMALNEAEKEAEIDEMLYDVGLDPYAKDTGSDEARKLKESLLNLKNIDINKTFATLDQKDFWNEFQRRLQDAILFLDPSVVANLDDARFFYRRNVTYKVVEWAIQQAQKRFASVPVLNIATFMIVRIHDMMLDQRHFHHNMLLHYFETIPESKLEMTKEEVDRAVSSIYEYRIEAINYMESNKAAADWMNYGFNKFYAMVRQGNTKIRTWQDPMNSTRFSNIKKINFGFAQVVEQGMKRIYHIHYTAHSYTKKPSLAYDYTSPNRVKRNRALLNLAQVGLGFVPMPNFLKGSVEKFIKSFYVQQVRMEGALIGYFESTGDAKMIQKIYDQRANFYILQ